MAEHHQTEAEGPDTSVPPAIPAIVRAAFAKAPGRIREYVTDPDFSIFFIVFMLGAALVFVRIRLPWTIGGFIFDEQEAILANPYVRGHQPWLDAFKRDFWGLLPDRSIGSYRPIPNFLWRMLWRLNAWKGAPVNTAFVWFNIVFHATNAALLASIVRGVCNRVGTAWLVGGIFCVSAILTEAVTGIVGIADVLGGLSLLLALVALSFDWWWIAPAVFAATLFGLLSKESAVVNVGLVPAAALVLSRAIDIERPRTIARTVAAAAGTLLALLLYFKIRHTWFHLELPLDEDLSRKGLLGRWLAKLQHYIGAPNLPVDPFNNPLADSGAKTVQRISGAVRVYWRGLVQVVVPNRLSPDYSRPQEPLPPLDHLVSWEVVFGGVMMVVPPLIGVYLALRAHLPTSWRSDRPRTLPGPRVAPERAEERPFDALSALLGFALIAWPASFFPLSNIPKTLPTIRAERFWYTPALATSIVLAVFIVWLARRWWYATAAAATLFFVFQTVQARRHANHYKDDLAFWQAAAAAVPNSAKAHLNYSVMLGARAGELWRFTPQQAQEARLVENIRATELAPSWDMAFIYVGDTLCQLGRMDEAWTWYVKGFRFGSSNTGLIALALQCLSDHTALLGKETEARALIREPQFTGSWLAYLVDDTLTREHKCRDVEVKAPPTELGIDEDDEATEGAASGSAGGSASPRRRKGASSSAASSSSAGSDQPIRTPAAPLPTCGVDPKYRPRGLDGDPKSD